MFLVSTVPPVSTLAANSIDANKRFIVCLSSPRLAGKPALTKIKLEL
jgi:hypothetical protein